MSIKAFQGLCIILEQSTKSDEIWRSMYFKQLRETSKRIEMKHIISKTVERKEYLIQYKRRNRNYIKSQIKSQIKMAKINPNVQL